MTHIAFIGFGEAAQAVAQGLCDEQGVAGLCAFDPRFADAAGGAELRERACERRVRVAETPADAVGGADLVFSLVVGSAAVAVGEAMAPALQPGQIFVDLNSISPDAKRAVGAALATGGGAQFVEGAVMARVLPYRHKVPILLAGAAAERAAELMRGVGMQVEPVGERIGQACAVKMIRSVVVKGIEALLLESLTAAERCGVRERILDFDRRDLPRPRLGPGRRLFHRPHAPAWRAARDRDEGGGSDAARVRARAAHGRGVGCDDRGGPCALRGERCASGR